MTSQRTSSILLDSAFEDEITKAIDAHAAWKVWLSSAIESGKVDADVADVRKNNVCALGKWLYGSTIPAHLDPNYIIVREIHANFHECAGRILELVLAGKKAQADAMMALDGARNRAASRDRRSAPASRRA